MADLVTQSKALMDSRQQRGTSRELARIRQSTEIATASHVANVDVVQSVTEAALLATAHVSALEAHLVGMVPHSEQRLRFVADAGAMAIAQAVVRTGRS